MRKLVLLTLFLVMITATGCSDNSTDESKSVSSTQSDVEEETDSNAGDLSIGDTISNDYFELTLDYVSTGDTLYNINAVDKSVSSAKKFTKFIDEFMKPLDLNSVSEDDKSVLKSGSYFVDSNYKISMGDIAYSSVSSGEEKQFIAIGYTIKYVGKEESYSSSNNYSDTIVYGDGYTFTNDKHSIRNIDSKGQNWVDAERFKSLSNDKFECREYFLVPNEVVENEGEELTLEINNYGFASVKYKIR